MLVNLTSVVHRRLRLFDARFQDKEINQSMLTRCGERELTFCLRRTRTAAGPLWVSEQLVGD